MEEKWEYKTIDGNWTKNPTAYCNYYKGCLTRKLVKVHRCAKRGCKSYDNTVKFDKD